MYTQVLLLCASLLVGFAGAALVLALGYRWGVFAALKAISANSPKWKAYLLAMAPPAALAATFLLDGTLHAYAGQVFWALAAPAAIGTCLRINYGRYSAL